MLNSGRSRLGQICKGSDLFSFLDCLPKVGSQEFWGLQGGFVRRRVTGTLVKRLYASATVVQIVDQHRLVATLAALHVCFPGVLNGVIELLAPRRLAGPITLFPNGLRGIGRAVEELGILLAPFCLLPPPLVEIEQNGCEQSKGCSDYQGIRPSARRHERDGG